MVLVQRHQEQQDWGPRNLLSTITSGLKNKVKFLEIQYSRFQQDLNWIIYEVSTAEQFSIADLLLCLHVSEEFDYHITVQIAFNRITFPQLNYVYDGHYV